ncbi:MAG: hypothetical protein MUE85_14195 [Microscillaceae bacterium]|jgi:hypothetical protein|nr:hypothetical protein [Microscillaceae bacterium]
MKKQRFEDWEYSQINEEFGYTRHFKHFALLDEWLMSTESINETEIKELKYLQEKLLYNTEVWGCISNLPPIALSFGEGRVRQKKRVNLKCTQVWNEDELKFMFISPLMRLVNFDSPYYKIFTQRKFSAIINNWELNGVFDLVVSKGEQHPKQPYFFLHEYKQERKKENDPLGQLLAAMIVAQNKNEKSIPLYGCFVVRRYYYFVALQDKAYSVSNSLNATEDDLFQIFKMFRFVKQKIDTFIK